jgi:UDP-N-acetylglucosamine acyltransferase
MPRIHPTAIVDADARIDQDVEIGPYCVVEGQVRIGAGSVLRSHSVVRRYTTMGRGNFVDSGACIAGLPQDLKFDPQTVSYVRIGDNNTFRENVTINRGSTDQAVTTIGNNTYWMTCSHVAHDATVADNVILANSAALGGHTTVGRGCFFSAHTALHQHCRVGPLTLIQGGGSATMHVPPYCLVSSMNLVAGINVVGLRRADWIDERDRREIKQAFRLLYRSKRKAAEALEEMDRQDWREPADAFRRFVREALEAPKPFNRGLCTSMGHRKV